MLACLFLSGLPGVALAKGPPPHGPPPLAVVVERHASEVGVDATTISRIHAMMKAERFTHEELRAEVRSAREALRSAMEADKPDPATVFEASLELGDAERALRDHRLSVDLAVIAELTPAQWAALRAQRPPMPQGHERPPRR
ncbi:MAG: periplasmic heavy metal sensor [Myxococcota bacterium]